MSTRWQRTAHRRGRCEGLALACCLLGCSATDAPGPAASRSFPPGAVARVGGSLVHAETVARIAAEQRLSRTSAQAAAIADALWAEGAVSRLGRRAQRSAERRVLARTLLADLWAEASRTPPSAAEVAGMVARHWIDLDRPVGYRTVHAVVLVDEKASTEQRDRARALAGELHDAVRLVAEQAARQPGPEYGERQMFNQGRGPTDEVSQAFIAAAGKVHSGGMKLSIQQLAPITADGRVIDRGAAPGSRFVQPFARAASALRRRGDLSEVIETPFGYDVIMLLQTTPASSVTARERRERTQLDIYRERARRLRDELLGRLRAAGDVEAAPNGDALMAEVDVAGRDAGAP